MGRIFTWEEVAEHKVPQTTSFITVFEYLARELAEKEPIRDILVCGSMLRGEHNIRSDVDGLVTYRQEEEGEAIAALQEATIFANSLYVPLELIPVSIGEARLSLHDIKPAFANHLLWAEVTGIIKGHPLGLFRFDHMTTITADTRNYLKNKLGRLLKDWAAFPIMSEKEQCRALRKVVETPLRVARKVLETRGFNVHIHGKKRLVSSYCEMFGGELTKMLVRLQDVDQEYTNDLYDHVFNPNQTGYQTCIEKLKTAVPTVCQFVRLNLQMFVEPITNDLPPFPIS
ncbi:MAG: hypothetical protein US94_C0013G0003 [Berkelbacteria bacterium GW2011_GWB1_38_5]|uniref:Polymerase nucleotidyl transferase domain-containing protein n=1 Tax=Berkelbacteria bacterium GW2011_GWB1_38_5 TaxID=1618336 RepID=A0A0G0K370_9BACT|nr:MAG: hypothetical protein US94_C0013G0003 [Berkelbacteria bacterium GW2011_GWB1_38_5]